ncbi:FAD-binding oxidoreductase [Halobacteriovorax vibrionivorans]|uniref:FAD-binding oxidoreductase n=1 Tax=Halobacteriovorax vibrionivorans TaxID=2152716 RepID=A0ABY0IDM6_9BACT|nr:MULTISPECIES: FAD-dependent oxidoreductase [Halobacteriovorax]RZF20700.1 FAD-binding oxidoreductase [Halobacteriovorax vibrionivorans]TGD48891.1 FAD-binding oxidoreductase [Halobacteriovorax sp. Y22]
MTKDFDYIVIGDGVAARSILYFLTRKFPDSRICQLFDNDAFPPCSINTTSVVSMGLFAEGLSKLGDILFHAHEFIDTFFKQEGIQGVHPATQYYLPPDIKEDPLKFKQFEARYGTNFENFKGLQTVAKDAYLINPQVFLGWLKAQYEDKIISRVQRVTELPKTNAKVILATSAYTSLFYKNKNLPEGKPVKGTFFSWNNFKADKSFVLSRGHYNLVYRKEDEILLFGANSIEGLCQLHSPKEVYEKLTIFEGDLPELKQLGSPQIHTGIRHKGKRRTPFCGEVEEGVYALTGLYKNGWSAGISLAKELVDML